MNRKSDKNIENPDRLSWQYSESEQQAQGFPWGPHKTPFSLDFEDVSISIEKCRQGLHYRREDPSGMTEKTILAERGNLLLSPVEPFHTPVAVSNHLLVELEHPVMLKPRSNHSLLVTFPLEIAAAFSGHKPGGNDVFDIFTLSRSKFTLYGPIKTGIVCKYWKSPIYENMPAVNPLRQGVMKIDFYSQLANWVEVQKVIFSAQGMKIYYSPHLVSLKAIMKIYSEATAETSFVDQPLQGGMNKGLELFSPRFLRLPGRTVMEEGY
ncbi:MAG: DUF432 domain-containing protein [Bacillota bacterium]